MVVADKTGERESVFSRSPSLPLFRVCTSERACAMRWNRVERKVKWSCRPAAVSEKRLERVSKERREGGGNCGGGTIGSSVALYAHKHNLELVTLFDVSRDANVILPHCHRRKRQRKRERGSGREGLIFTSSCLYAELSELNHELLRWLLLNSYIRRIHVHPERRSMSDALVHPHG